MHGDQPLPQPNAEASGQPVHEPPARQTPAVARPTASRPAGLPPPWLRIPKPWRPLLLLASVGGLLVLRALQSSEPPPLRRPLPLVATEPVRLGIGRAHV